MRLKSDKRQNNQQMRLAFSEEYRGEAPKDLVKGTESLVVCFKQTDSY